MPYEKTTEFLDTVQEFSAEGLEYDQDDDVLPTTGEKRWVMKAAKRPHNLPRRSLRQWAIDSWTRFVDLLKVRISENTPWIL